MLFIGTPNSVTITKHLRNDGAGDENSDAERSAFESDEDEELSPKNKMQQIRVARNMFL